MVKLKSAKFTSIKVYQKYTLDNATKGQRYLHIHEVIPSQAVQTMTASNIGDKQCNAITKWHETMSHVA